MSDNTWRTGPRHREPAELMKPIIDPAGWYPKEYAGSQEWIYTLNDTEIAEVLAAVDRILAGGLQMIDVTKDDFEVPICAEGKASASSMEFV